MDVQEARGTAGLFSRRFFARHLLAHAENRGAALLYGVADAVLAFLFARTHAVCGAYPFAIGYLAASDRRVLPAYVGSLLGALTLGSRGYVYAVAYTALLFLRLFLSYPRASGGLLPPSREFFEEPPSLRVAAACAAGLFLSLYQLLAGGLAMVSLAFAIASLLLPVLLCLLYLGFFTAGCTPYACLVGEVGRTGKALLPLALALGALGFSLVRAVGGAAFLGISVPVVLSAFLCLLLPCCMGPYGAGAALLAATAACLTVEGVAYLPAYAAVALCCVLLFRMGYAYALTGAAVAGGLLSYLLMGEAAILSFLPELLCCLALAWPFFKALPRLSAMGKTGEAQARAAAQATARAMTADNTRLIKFADAFSSLSEVFARLSGGHAQVSEGCVREDKNSSMAGAWRTTAAMLRDAALREEEEGREDVAAARAAARVFEELNARPRHVTVLGSRARVVLARGVRWEADHPEERLLRRRLEDICGCRLSPPLLSPHGGQSDFCYRAARRFAVRVHSAGVARGREVSGDQFSLFEGEGDRCYALLSDGMGSGQEAAITAGICGAFLRGVLPAGAGIESALCALNRLLCEREGECTATVDLVEIDLLSGQAAFLKCGAASSYVRRGDSLFHIPAGRLPIGILSEPDGEQTNMRLMDGDRVVLLSDGVSQSPEDAFWLCEMLSDRWEEDAELMTERILNAARAHTEQPDDMTVAILQIDRI